MKQSESVVAAAPAIVGAEAKIPAVKHNKKTMMTKTQNHFDRKNERKWKKKKKDERLWWCFVHIERVLYSSPQQNIEQPKKKGQNERNFLSQWHNRFFCLENEKRTCEFPDPNVNNFHEFMRWAADTRQWMEIEHY